MCPRGGSFSAILPHFFEIHPVFLGKIVLTWQKNPSPLCIVPFFKRHLALFIAHMNFNFTVLGAERGVNAGYAQIN